MGRFSIDAMVLMQASPERIFEEIQDLRRFNNFNSFMNADMQMTYSDHTIGEGAFSDWDSKGNSGRMTVVENQWPSQLTARMDFRKPFASTANVQLRVFGTEHGTEVWWVMTGERPPLQSVMSTVLRLDNMLKGNFRKSLLKLKDLVEQ